MKKPWRLKREAEVTEVAKLTNVIKLLIVDDNAPDRDGLKYSLIDEPDIEVVGEAENGMEAVELAEKLKPNVVLMDLRMPIMGGAQATEKLVAMDPPPYVIALSTYQTDSDVGPAMKAGASHHMRKDAPIDQLLRAIRSSGGDTGGGMPRTSRQTQLVRDEEPRPGSDVLSEIELDVLKWVAHGQTNSQVAARLAIEEAEVRTHLFRIYKEFGVRDRSGAVGEGRRRKILL
jgi:DNA-binding NarL/FixJ family response regulator